MKKLFLFLFVVLSTISLMSCDMFSGDTSKENDNGSSSEKLSTISIEKVEEKVKPEFSAYSRIPNENNTGYYKFYYFNLGTVKGIPVVTAETYEYNGVPMEVEYNMEKATETGIENSIEKGVALSTTNTVEKGTQIVRGAQNTNSKTYDYSVENSSTTGGSLTTGRSTTVGTEAEVDAFFGKASVKAEVNVSIEGTIENSVTKANTTNWGNEFSKTNSVEVANSYEQSTSNTKDTSISNAYSTYSNSSYAVSKTITYKLENVEKGFYRYGLFVLCDVYLILVIDTAENKAYMEYQMYPIEDKFYYGVQYSKNMSYDEELSDKFAVDLNDIIDYLNYDVDNSLYLDSYVVNFNSDGGSSVPSQSVNAGGKVIKPTNPTKQGYAFEGWYTDKNLVIEYNFNNYVTDNIVLYAKWTATQSSKDEYYKVSFDTNGGNSISSISVKVGSKVAKPTNPTKQGYAFKDKEENGRRDKRITAEDKYTEEIHFSGIDLDVLRSLGYEKVTIKIEFDRKEINDGYQEFWCYTQDNNEFAYNKSEHGSGKKNTSWARYRAADIVMSIYNFKSSDGAFWMRWGAQGKYDDDWWLGFTKITMIVSK